MSDTKSDSTLKQYIEYYKDLKEPGYAVLVNGEWGVGKTFQVKKILGESEIFYISLFGITSINEIHASVFLKMYPARAKSRKLLSLFNRNSIKISGITLPIGNLIENVANALIKEKVDNSRIIVFDDLERCKKDHEEIYGAINKYVEHHKCRVIVIAHDDELTDKLTDKQEKIFGQK